MRLPLFTFALASTLLFQSSVQLPYRNAKLPTAERVKDLLGRMTLEEKFWQLFMIPGDLDDPSHDYSHGVFGLQISVRAGGIQRRIPCRPRARGAHQRHSTLLRRADAARHPDHPLRRGRSWPRPRRRDDVSAGDRAGGDLGRAAGIARVRRAIARETRSRGIRQVLSPVINIADDVRWGRVEETYGEDPYLSTVMGLAFVDAFEKQGIVTTPKHFVANVGEGGRDSYPIDHSERLLMERYFPPFEAAIRQGRARSVMTAYNSVDGAPATQNRRLLTDVLKRDWGFEGFVISDAAATGGATVLHMTEPNTPIAAQHAFEAGLDVVFQSSWPQYRPYWDAFQRGLIPQPMSTRPSRACYE